jgi:26S proteasome regulatory subunit (ATPase 3-interacting protein)
MGVNETVLKYLKDQNRPYSANDIMQNLHKEFGKTAVQKALDYLVAVS